MPRYRFRCRGLYAIIDVRYVPDQDLDNMLTRLIRIGVCAIQMRDKGLGWHDRLTRIRRAVHIAQPHGIPIIVNDDPFLMKVGGAQGVHLGGEEDHWLRPVRALFPHHILGLSCYNSVERALAGALAGVDYIALGSVFPSESEPHRPRVSREVLRRAQQCLCIPVVAIGGITPENARSLQGYANAVAMMRALTTFPEEELTKVNSLFA